MSNYQRVSISYRIFSSFVLTANGHFGSYLQGWKSETPASSCAMWEAFVSYSTDVVDIDVMSQQATSDQKFSLLKLQKPKQQTYRHRIALIIGSLDSFVMFWEPNIQSETNYLQPLGAQTFDALLMMMPARVAT